MPLGSSSRRVTWRSSFLVTILIIWKERNHGCFEGKLSSMEALIDGMRFFIASWVSSYSFPLLRYLC